MISEQLQKFLDREPALFDDRVKQRAGQIATFMNRHGGRPCRVGAMHQAVMTARRSNDIETAALKRTDHVR